MALIDLLIEFSLCYHQFIALRTVVYKLRVQKKIRLVIPGGFFLSTIIQLIIHLTDFRIEFCIYFKGKKCP